MKEGKVYPHSVNKAKKAPRKYSKRMLVFCSSLLFGFSANAALPSFVNGFLQPSSVCESATASSINSILAIADADAGQTETWTVLAGPLHGTLAGFSTTGTSTGGTVVPTGLSYSPTSGYIGNDTFTIRISDGLDTATTTVIMTVKPLPKLSSSLTPPGICDGTAFNYAPTSATSGATFSWSRAFVGGISNPTATGTGNPMETLFSATYYAIPVTYAYKITASGCSSFQNVVVSVKPTPRLSSELTASICSGGTFSYTPTSSLTGTTYTWSRAAVSGITPATASSGTGAISETLANTTSAPLAATYAFSLDAGGCVSTRNVVVTVNPQSAAATIGTKIASVCAGTNNQTFGASAAPTTGTTYRWTAVNAKVTGTGGNGQYVLISFPTAGIATVKLQTTIAGGCVSNDTASVNVGTSVAATGTVIYSNSQFIYLDNTVERYQWGFDDANLTPTVIEGAVFQSYPNAAPDMTGKYYWVKTTKGGCTQKTYFNKPLAITGTQAVAVPALAVYPNPASGVLSVDINGIQGSSVEVAITNMMGQTLVSKSGVMNNTQFDVTGMPAGVYLVNCSQNGVKIATARFIKN